MYTPPFEVRGERALLVNLDTDTVLYEKNADRKMAPASLTKIMTAAVILENDPDLTAEITAKHQLYNEFVGQAVSTAGILPGESVTVKSLVYGLLRPAGIEAANILADFSGGTLLPLRELMNEKAMALSWTIPTSQIPTGFMMKTSTQRRRTSSKSQNTLFPSRFSRKSSKRPLYAAGDQ